MDKILNSWKEIARYAGRGVRTVQRWERDLGFPVRRPRHKQRSAVVALPPEIDAWFLKASHRAENGAAQHTAYDAHAFRERTQLLLARANTLKANTLSLQEQVARVIQLNERLRDSRRSA